jgi:hypothetical protein
MYFLPQIVEKSLREDELKNDLSNEVTTATFILISKLPEASSKNILKRKIKNSCKDNICYPLEKL